MINLKPYDQDSFEFHKSVVSKKNEKKTDPTYKDRLVALHDEIEHTFRKYSNLLAANDLESITPYGFVSQKRIDLLSLYRFKSKLLQELNTLLTTTKLNRKFNTCQMCTIEPIGSFDHILPKEEFPEFSVNPINLFPCCLKCNGKKSTQWLIDGERAFLNLYYDLLPSHQYLKVEFSSYPIPIFSLDGSGLESDFFRLLKSHYEKLDLLTRFRENSNEVIDPVITDAKRIVPIIGIGEYRKTVEESTSEIQLIYGLNHWKGLLKLALVSHGDFRSLLT